MQVNCGRNQSQTDELCVTWVKGDMTVIFPLFSLLQVVTCLSCLEILIWSCVYPLRTLCLTTLPLSFQTHLPTSLFLCQAAGITQMGLAQARMLIWEKDACFIVKKKRISCFLFTLSHSITAHWYLFFKLWKLPVSASYGFVYRFVSQCWMLCAHMKMQSLLLILRRQLCGIWQRVCCSVDLIWFSACESRAGNDTTALIWSCCLSLGVCWKSGHSWTRQTKQMTAWVTSSMSWF